MKLVANLRLIASIAILSACSGGAQNPQLSLDDVAPDILQVLPDEIEGFTYRGARTYPDPWGYSLRYRHGSDEEVEANLFIYPVPGNLEAYQHVERVDLMSVRELGEIKAAYAQGAFTQYSVVHGASFSIDGSYATRTDIFLLKDDIASFSLLFLTESNGKLLKLRITMPDNYSNRHNENWPRFAETMFRLILQNIDKA